MVINQTLTDKEIEKYYQQITIKSLWKGNGFAWMVCCKKCGGEMFPYLGEDTIEKEEVDQARKEHICLEIKGYGI